MMAGSVLCGVRFEMSIHRTITRRDFLNGTLLASGAALVSTACPFELMAAQDWNGTSGIGDYADANGNTHQVMADGHTIRDHVFDRTPAAIQDTGEIYECVIVGGGISGLSAALFYQRATSMKKSCLVLENHPIFGGEAKRNEFNVDGQRLIASQGSAMWFQPLPGSFLQHFYDSVGIDPRQFVYQQNAGHIATGVTPYAGDGSNFGFFFGGGTGRAEGTWLVDPWTKKLDGAPISAEAKRELLAMQNTPDHHPKPRRHGDAVARQLDSITLEDDLMARYGLSRDTIRRYLSPVTGGGSGIGADVLSAYSDYAPDLLFPWEKQQGPQMFPGGNTGVARHIVKALQPNTIPGPANMASICQSRVNFAALDQPHQPTRIRLRSTVISIAHEGEPAYSPHVNIVYLREGRLRDPGLRRVQFGLFCVFSFRGPALSLLIRGLQNECDRPRQAVPTRLFRRELPSPLRRKAVELRLAAILRLAPLSGQQAALFQAVQRWIQRSLLHVQHLPGDLPDAQRNSVAVNRAHCYDLQDQHIQRALQKVGLIGRRHRTALLSMTIYIFVPG